MTLASQGSTLNRFSIKNGHVPVIAKNNTVLSTPYFLIPLAPACRYKICTVRHTICCNVIQMNSLVSHASVVHIRHLRDSQLELLLKSNTRKNFTWTTFCKKYFQSKQFPKLTFVNNLLITVKSNTICRKVQTQDTVSSRIFYEQRF